MPVFAASLAFGGPNDASFLSVRTATHSFFGNCSNPRPSGGIVFYFPIATSVVISLILSLVLYVLAARVMRVNRELATNPTSAKPLTTQNTCWWPVAPGDWSSR